MLINQDLIRKYNIRGPRYTSYPTANEFHEGITPSGFIEHLEGSNGVGPANISLYFHVPFCPKLCHFCGCHTHLSTADQVHSKYIDQMINEMDSVFSHLDPARPITQIHWGGGTPNAIRLSLIARVMDRIHSQRTISRDAEIAIECNPSNLDRDSVNELAAIGFNRISIGIQDFNPEVLKAVNRDPSRLPVEELIGHIRMSGITGINLDFIYGLPLQTVESFLETIRKAISLQPDRLVTFSYAHVPWVKKAQKIMEDLGIPDETVKMTLLEQSSALLKSAGYTMVGIDHYALPSDPLAKAKENRTLHRNFQGYCTRETTGQVYAFGASAITQLETGYFQNHRVTSAYQEAVALTGQAVHRGYILSSEDRIVRSAITELMCNGRVRFEEIGRRHGVTADAVAGVLRYHPGRFGEMVEDGLMTAGPDEIRITPAGEFLARVVALRLDPRERDQGAYSKTI
jgi:oxygen-independent coproporphyrinogen-3 oxidase